MTQGVLFVGMGGALTNEAFWTLWSGGVNIVGVVKSYPFDDMIPLDPVRLFKRHWLPNRRENSWLDALSMREIIPDMGIDLLEVTDINCDKALKWIRKRKPSLICVAAYPQIFKRELLKIPQFGCINMHPSPLPRYRGPNPLFWMFKDAALEAGVSIHFLHDGIDDGDIIYQEFMPINEGMTGRELNRALAKLGAPLMLCATQDIFANRIRHIPQDATQASYQSHPKATDLKVDRHQSACRVFKFVRGVSCWMQLYLEIEGERFDIQQAISYQIGKFVPGDYLLLEQNLFVNCDDGNVHLQIAQTADL